MAASLDALFQISIHALREEGDRPGRCALPSAGISIHALREEGDYRRFKIVSCRLNFYPRPPRGGRPDVLELRTAQLNFYPRPPRGGRPDVLELRTAQLNFYPRPPRGGRPTRRPAI